MAANEVYMQLHLVLLSSAPFQGTLLPFYFKKKRSVITPAIRRH